jgi:hypothetical protein
MLDPVVATRPPTRRGNRDRRPHLVVLAPIEATVFGGVVAIPVAVEHQAVL